MIMKIKKYYFGIILALTVIGFYITAGLFHPYGIHFDSSLVINSMLQGDVFYSNWLGWLYPLMIKFSYWIFGLEDAIGLLQSIFYWFAVLIVALSAMPKSLLSIVCFVLFSYCPVNLLFVSTITNNSLLFCVILLALALFVLSRNIKKTKVSFCIFLLSIFLLLISSEIRRESIIFSFPLSFYLCYRGSCAKEYLENTSCPDVSRDVVYAEVNNTKTSVIMGTDPKIVWNVGDEISVFRSMNNEQYRLVGDDTSSVVMFTHVSGSAGVIKLQTAYSIYPYNESNAITNEGLSVKFPNVQYYKQNSFGIGSTPMVASCQNGDNLSFLFRPLSSYLRFKLWNSQGRTVKKLILSSSSTVIAGTATVEYSDSLPSVTMSTVGVKSITLDCGAGVELGTEKTQATEFWFALPPVLLEDGFSLKVVDSNGNEYTKSSFAPRELERNVISTMAPIECRFNDELFICGTSTSKPHFTLGDATWDSESGYFYLSIADASSVKTLKNLTADSSCVNITSLTVHGIKIQGTEDYLNRSFINLKNCKSIHLENNNFGSSYKQYRRMFYGIIPYDSGGTQQESELKIYLDNCNWTMQYSTSDKVHSPFTMITTSKDYASKFCPGSIGPGHYEPVGDTKEYTILNVYARGCTDSTIENIKSAFSSYCGVILSATYTVYGVGEVRLWVTNKKYWKGVRHVSFQTYFTSSLQFNFDSYTWTLVEETGFGE